MTQVQTYVFVYLDGEAVPAGLLRLTSESRASFATFAYGAVISRPRHLPARNRAERQCQRALGALSYVVIIFSVQ